MCKHLYSTIFVYLDIVIRTNKMNCELMLTYDTPALRQTGSRNLMGPKTLPTIWGTYMKLVTKNQISAINSYWEKCDEIYLGRTEGRTEVKQYTPLPLQKNQPIRNKNRLWQPCLLTDRLPETRWEVVSHSDWQTWKSCRSEKEVPKNSLSHA